MAMKMLHKAIFFQTEQDKTLRRAFILRWMVDKEKNDTGFSIEPPSVDDGGIYICTKYPYASEKDFSNMVHMMKLMINPVEVVVE